MPYINLNGQLIEVTQEQYDIYTIGQNQNPAAGGNVLQLNNTQTILSPNTTNTSPNQPLPVTQQRVIAESNTALTSNDPGFVYNDQGELIPAGSAPAVELVQEQQFADNLQEPAGATDELGVNSLTEPPGTEQDPTLFNEQPEVLVNLNTGQELLIDEESGLVQADEGGLLIFPEDLNSDEANVPDGGLVEFTDEGSIVRQPEEVSETALYGTPYDDEGNLNPGWELDGDGNPYYRGYSQGKLWINPNTADSAAATRELARQQQTISQQRKQINNGDWRVRLRLAPQSKYLYNAPNPGILEPLRVTDGIIFPYTPQIDTAYRANYSPYDLTHSNYRGYYYQNSYVDALNLRCTFTAQSTDDANYLLAVIHFCKSATKMFYGQDAERGSPPPLVYLTGLGQYQFNEHPCLIQQFNYSLPSDVDYIRARSAGTYVNLPQRRDKQTVSVNSLFGGLNRLANALLPKGGVPTTPAPTSLGQNSPTYVPTKIDIGLTLLPVQSRSQISKQFSVKEFANGNLLKGGFW